MDLEPECVAALRHWAANNPAVYELWLFGSRAKGTSQVESDVDLAVILMPEVDNTNWALAMYIESKDFWKTQLGKLAGRPVSLSAIEPGTELFDEVMATGICLWSRLSR
ncbi:MAG: nucleotidyltransferase domain-containing protein [Xanthobacteraceae bacterium]